MVKISDLRQAVASVQKKEAEAMTVDLLSQGLDPMEILEDGAEDTHQSDRGCGTHGNPEEQTRPAHPSGHLVHDLGFSQAQEGLSRGPGYQLRLAYAKEWNWDQSITRWFLRGDHGVLLVEADILGYGSGHEERIRMFRVSRGPGRQRDCLPVSPQRNFVLCSMDDFLDFLFREFDDSFRILAVESDFHNDDVEVYFRRFMSASCSASQSERADYTHAGQLRDRPGFDENADGLQPAKQLERIVDSLKKSHDTRSGSMVLLGPSDQDTVDEAPGVVSVSFNIVDERLYGSYVLRCEDIHGVWPFDALSLVRLQRQVAERVGIPVGSATFIVHSAHVYERDWDAAQKTLDTWFKRPLPLRTDPAGLFLFGLDEGRARGMLIDHQADAVLWEGEFDDPEEMSWYIVDVMPWLSPQHIRYIGQECASLMRALRTGEEYEQG